MHRLISSRINVTRGINDNGELVSNKKQQELEKLPFSARTPRGQPRSRTALSNATESSRSPIQKPPMSARISKQPSVLSDPRDKVNNLLFDGIHCTATKQKHDIINQLGSLLLDQINQNDVIKSDVERLEKLVRQLEVQLESQRLAAEKTSKKAERVAKLRHLKTLSDDESIINEIKNIEQDAQKFVHLSEPWLLEEAMELEREDKMEALINLKFRRLEDLIYGLRRQILQDQDIMSVLPLIKDKFGSVRNLLAKYNEATETISRLKVREFKYSNNELYKRRPLAEYDVQSLHTLIIALQNELTECKSELRASLRLTKYVSGSEPPPDINEPIDFDLITKYNTLEASHAELLKRYEQQKKDLELLAQEATLESDILKNGIFKIEDKLKSKLLETNRRLVQYNEDVKKMQSTIDLQQNLVFQFQKEKAAIMRSKITLNNETMRLKKHIDDLEAKHRDDLRKINTIRGLSRVLTENVLAKRQDYTSAFDNLQDTFYEIYQKYDAAALIIQKAWRKTKSPEAEKILVHKPINFPIAPFLTMTTIDILVGKAKPVTYKQMVKMLKSFTFELRDAANGPMEIIFSKLKAKHSEINELNERLLLKGKRDNSSQTIPDRIDVEAQTERLPLRSKR